MTSVPRIKCQIMLIDDAPKPELVGLTLFPLNVKADPFLFAVPREQNKEYHEGDIYFVDVAELLRQYNNLSSIVFEFLVKPRLRNRNR